MATKVERAVALLRETADALEELPDMLRRESIIFGQLVTVARLREEADWIERAAEAIKAATEESNG